MFSGNVVQESGAARGCGRTNNVGCVVTDNVFDRNGRKPNGPGKHYTWNANITINEAYGDKSGSPTQDYMVAGNVIYSTKERVAAIRVDATGTTAGIVLRNNLLRGENCTILLEGSQDGASRGDR